jgi:transposase
MKAKDIERRLLSAERVLELLALAKAQFKAEDYQDLENLVKSFAYLTQLLEEKNTSIHQLRKLLFGFKSEKLAKVLEKLTEDSESHAGNEESDAPRDAGGEVGAHGSEDTAKKKHKGHGRAGADAYTGAERIRVGHSSLKPGDRCPESGCKGKVYTFVPRQLVRIFGQAPIAAKVTEIEQLRCNLCLKVFTATMPPDALSGKYDATAASMIALLRYGTGVPFNRLKGLEKSFGIPLSPSTQWDVVERASKKIARAYTALIVEAAQGDVLHNDDTPMKILELMKKKKKTERADDG